MIDAILLAAGIGTRMKADKPKQLLEIGGVPIIIHPLRVLQSIDNIEIIKVPCPPSYLPIIEDLVQEYDITKAVCFNGGSTRQESVYRSLSSSNNNRVLIHESSRPFITKDFVVRLIHSKFNPIVPVVPIRSSIVSLYSNPEYPERDSTYYVQFPQIYTYDLLRKVHEKSLIQGRKSNEDSSMVSDAGFRIYYVPGMRESIKITDEYDLVMAEAIYQRYFKEG